MSDELDVKFWEFHEDNPIVFKLFKKFANEAKNKGFNNYSANAIFERIRWHIDIETTSNDGFKLNNNYRSRYARLLSVEEPEFDGFFRTRTLQTASKL